MYVHIPEVCVSLVKTRVGGGILGKMRRPSEQMWANVL